MKDNEGRPDSPDLGGVEEDAHASRYLERDRPLRVDEVLAPAGAPALGRRLVADREHLLDEETVAEFPAMESVLYRALVFEGEGGRVAFVALFDRETEVMRAVEFHHLHLNATLPLPNFGSPIPSARAVEIMLARLAEAAAQFFSSSPLIFRR